MRFMIYTQKILLERSNGASWAGQVARGTCWGEDNAYKVWWWFLKERGDVKDLDIDGSIIFAYIVFYNLL